MSDGLKITVNLGMDSNVGDIVDPDDPTDDSPNSGTGGNTGNNNRPDTGLE